ncbi:TRAP transporter permease [Oleispirillum naphthae]|uniref:TRAP transporter permease n=1 Tax=Oleispirillum naphthae TaxID=2838853 RepID=UPI00308254B9
MLFRKKKDSDEIDLKNLDQEGSRRELTGGIDNIVYVLAIFMSLFHIYALSIQAVTMWYVYSFHVGMAAVLTFALYRGSAKSSGNAIPLYDYLIIAATVFAFGYLMVEVEGLVYRIGVSPTTLDLVVSIILILGVLEFTRRTCGNILPTIAIIFLAYAQFGHLLPGRYGHRAYSWGKTLSYMMGLDGIFSTPIQASASFVFLFIVFGAFLSVSGASKFFIDLAVSVSGAYRGGPAKVAIISSALFGTVSGNSVANVVSSGSFTIPMMKSIGYKNAFAAAVEATASTGGQIMPPILGSAAFIMASIIGIPYMEIVKASLIPALLYFYTVFITVDLEAVKHNLTGLPKDQLPKFKTVALKEGYLILPLFVLIFTLAVLDLSPIRASVWGIVTAIAVTYLRKETRLGPRGILKALSDGAKSSCGVIAACATAGIVIGVLNLTGVGLKFASAIVALSEGNLWIALVMTMIACLILGMGLPTTAAYLICASVASPALVQLGVSELASHMFVFYFACISAITPPVALAAYAGAGLAKAKPIEVAFIACKLGITAFIVPFMFISGPSLLGVGKTSVILLATASAMIGATLLACGFQLQAFSLKLDKVSGILLVLCGLVLIKPGISSDAAGLAVAAVVLGFAYLRNKKAAARKDGTAASGPGADA